MKNSKKERFSYLSDKAAKQTATPHEMAEYHLLLDEWGSPAITMSLMISFFAQSKIVQTINK